MKIRFWGVRGSIAVSGPRYVHTGGNTSCLEVETDGSRLILDGGTGLRALGETLGFTPIDTTLCFSHVHWDHIQGVPFFPPAFHPGSRLRMVGADGLQEALAAQMRPPQFPIRLDALRARLDWQVARPGEPFEVGPFRITAVEVPHPDRTFAWRVEGGGASFVYATDTELASGARALRSLAEGADLLVQDAQYTAEELPERRGWGHSSWGEAVHLAIQAGVRRLGLFHHDPGRGDDDVARVETWARIRLPGAFAAREGLELAL